MSLPRYGVQTVFLVFGLFGIVGTAAAYPGVIESQLKILEETRHELGDHEFGDRKFGDELARHRVGSAAGNALGGILSGISEPRRRLPVETDPLHPAATGWRGGRSDCARRRRTSRRADEAAGGRREHAGSKRQPRRGTSRARRARRLHIAFRRRQQSRDQPIPLQRPELRSVSRLRADQHRRQAEHGDGRQSESRGQ